MVVLMEAQRLMARPFHLIVRLQNATDSGILGILP